MNIKEALYGSNFKRVIMRFLEIFVLAGAIALTESPELSSLVPAIYVGILASVAKVLRARLLK